MKPKKKGGEKMKKGRILLVEDDKEFAGTIKEFLNDLGYETTFADNGKEALETLLKNKRYYHLLLSDYHMPGMNGLQLMEAIKENKIDIEKILFSGVPTNTTSLRAKNLGVIESISKPISLEFLEETIGQILTNKAFGQKKKYALRSLKTSSEIELIHRKTVDINKYSSGSEYLLCQLNEQETQVAIISLFLRHLEVEHGLCLSVSSGCPKNCPKCFSGTTIDFDRHFTSDEIIAMTKIVLKESFYYDKAFWLYDLPFFIAIMGSGDIAFNFEQTMAAMEKINHVFGERFVCNISTAFATGISKINAYISEQLEQKHKLVPNLQISLDSLDRKIRKQLVDSNEKPETMIQEAKEYYQLTGKRVTDNYVMCSGVNDTTEETERIKRQLDPNIFKIKLSKSKLPPDSQLISSDIEKIEAIKNDLQNQGFIVEIFDEKKQMGFETGGSCGTIVHGL